MHVLHELCTQTHVQIVHIQLYRDITIECVGAITIHNIRVRECEGERGREGLRGEKERKREGEGKSERKSGRGGRRVSLSYHIHY